MAAARECAAALEPCCVTYRSTQNPSNECSEERPSRPPSPPLNPHCLDAMCRTPISTNTIDHTQRAVRARSARRRP